MGIVYTALAVYLSGCLANILCLVVHPILNMFSDRQKILRANMSKIGLEFDARKGIFIDKNEMPFRQPVWFTATLDVLCSWVAVAFNLKDIIGMALSILTHMKRGEEHENGRFGQIQHLILTVELPPLDVYCLAMEAESILLNKPIDKVQISLRLEELSRRGITINQDEVFQRLEYQKLAS